MARVARHRRPLRAASRHPSDHLEGRARRAAAAGRPRPDRRDAGRRGLPHPSLLAAAAGLAALAARPRDGDPEMRLGRGRLAALAHGGPVPAVEVRRRRQRRRVESGEAPPKTRPLRFRRVATCRSISSGCARRIPSGSSRSPSDPAACGLSAASRSAAGSSRRWSRAGRSISFRAETELDFDPQTFQQAAGLTSTTTTATSSISSASPMTHRTGHAC